jgi:signal peptide peptidase SppA
MKITGGITDATARKVENALRKLKNKDDVKCLVLRVDSPGGSITACETIHQELQDLPQKVVVSFGNVSASGGYYISANADRIYALPTTITGSIGVFMIKLGLEGLAKRYGITFDAVTTSELSGCFDPFFPVNKRMKDNFQNYTDRAYVHFKKLVGEGRNMDIDDVENVAKGRVWTGSQAKELGLVDELGGLQRAIAYAQKTHTETGDATVVAWPPPLTFWQLLEKRRNPKSNDDTDDFDMPSFWHALLSAFESPSPTSNFTLSGMLKGDDYAVGGLKPPSAMSGVMLAMDENTAIRCLLEENHIEDDILSSFPSDFFQ